MWCSNDVFRYTFKAEFDMLASLKVPPGRVDWEKKRDVNALSV